MYYSTYFSAEAIPTNRRLDYAVEKMDPIQSGFLYAVFRKMPSLYPDDIDLFPWTSLSQKMESVNRFMTKADLTPIFTDTNDFFKWFFAYDYYWNLKTDNQFICEEAFARAGLSDFPPLDPKDLAKSSKGELFEKKISAFDSKKFDRDAKQYWTGDRIDGVNQGKGTLYYSNGDLYTGQIVDGKFHGEGVFYCGSLLKYYNRSSNNLFWAGEWKDGLPWNGKGMYHQDKINVLGFDIPGSIINATIKDGRPTEGYVKKFSVELKGDNCRIFCNHSKFTD